MTNLINPFWAGGIDLTDGLVAYWKLDDTLTGGASETFVDSFGSHDGTADSVVSGGLTFQVTDSAYTPTDGDELDIPSHTDFDFTNGSNDLPFSIALWNEVTTLDTTHRCPFINRWTGDSNGHNWLFWKNTNYEVEVYIADGASSDRLQVYTSNQGDVAGFYHYVMTYDGSGSENGIEIYINKVKMSVTRTEVGTYTHQYQNSTSFLRIGGVGTGNRTRSGWHDDYKIWNKVLSQDEIDLDWANGDAGNPMF